MYIDVLILGQYSSPHLYNNCNECILLWPVWHKMARSGIPAIFKPLSSWPNNIESSWKSKLCNQGLTEQQLKPFELIMVVDDTRWHHTRPIGLNTYMIKALLVYSDRITFKCIYIQQLITGGSLGVCNTTFPQIFPLFPQIHKQKWVISAICKGPE